MPAYRPRGPAASRPVARRLARATSTRARRARRRGRFAGTGSGRARRASRSVSPVAENRPDASLLGTLDEECAERHVAGRETAVPEEDPLAAALASRHAPDNDVGELSVQRLLCQQPAIDVLPERAEAVPRAALAPIVHHDLAHDGEEIELDRTHRPVRNHEHAFREPRRAQDRLRLDEPRRLDDDVRALDGLPHRVAHAHALSELLLESAPELLTRLGATARHPDLLEAEERVEEDDVPERGSTRADVTEDTRVRSREVLGADGRQRPSASVGEVGGIDDRRRRTRLRIEQREQPELGRQVAAVVVDEVPYDLDSGRAERRDIRAEHVPVPAKRGRGVEMDTRLEDDLALTLRADDVLHGGDQLGRPDLELREIGGSEKTKGELPSPGRSLAHHRPYGDSARARPHVHGLL